MQFTTLNLTLMAAAATVVIAAPAPIPAPVDVASTLNQVLSGLGAVARSEPAQELSPEMEEMLNDTLESVGMPDQDAETPGTPPASATATASATSAASTAPEVASL